METPPLRAAVRSGRDAMQEERVVALLHSVPWGRGRTLEQLRRELAESLCFGVFLPIRPDGDSRQGGETQVGFARALIDSAGTYHLCDVVVAEEWRGQGLGTRLVRAVTQAPELWERTGTLETENAHGFYEKAGFFRCGRVRMLRRPQSNAGEESL